MPRSLRLFAGGLALATLAGVGAGCGGSSNTTGSGGRGGGTAGGSGGSGTGGIGGGTSGGAGGSGGSASCSSAGGAAAVGGGSGSAIVDAGYDRYVGDGPASDPAFQTFCQAVRLSMIARNERCNGLTPLQAEAVVNIDPCAAWGSALDTQRMAFDGSKAAGCVTALQSPSCAGDVPTACDGVLTGLVPNYAGAGTAGGCQLARQLTLDGQTIPGAYTDGAASLFTECVPGSFCVVSDPTAVGPLAICSPRPRTGDACPNPTTSPCYASVCDHTGRCAVAKASGESCVASSDCAAGLYCGSSSTCAPKHASGSCTSAGECLLPATCDNGSCGIRPRGRCCTNLGTTDCAGGESCGLVARRCYTASLIGQPCMLGVVDCFVGRCDTTSGTCQVGQPGSACVLSPRNATCGPNALCLLTANQASQLTCQTPGF